MSQNDRQGVEVKRGFEKQARSTDRPGIEQAREIVADAKEHGTVISLQRVGANSMLRYTPYRNHRGTLVGMWSCISYHFEAMPERTLLSYPHIVRPWEHDDWEVNLITTPWVVQRVAHTAWGKLELLPVEESPFDGRILEWDTAQERCSK